MLAEKEKTLLQYTTALSLTELGLGSIFHATHTPLAGHLLSLNQSVILTFSLKHTKQRRDAMSRVCSISNLAALLKSLAPAGKILTPMLAITMQGALFAVGVLSFGVNSLGIALGAALLALWGFVQPLLISYILFGESFFAAIRVLWQNFAVAIHLNPFFGLRILLGFVFLKCIILASSSVGAWRASSKFEESYLRRLETLQPKTKKKHARTPLSGAVRDLANPYFLLSLCLSLGFFVFSAQESKAAVAIYALRCLIVAFIFFWGMRALPGTQIQEKVKGLRRVNDLLLEVTRRQR